MSGHDEVFPSRPSLTYLLLVSQTKVMFDQEFKINAVAIKTTVKGVDHHLGDQSVHHYPPTGLGVLVVDHLSLEDWMKGIL